MMKLTALKQSLRSKRTDYKHQSTYFVVDGEAVCHCCVRKNFRDYLQTIKNQSSSGFNVECEDVNLENAALFCAFCQESIPAVYRAKGKQ